MRHGKHPTIRRTPNRARTAFTLVEMLVVIAIIGILAAMLMPSLTKALLQAKGISCANNCKQIAVASSSYMNDFNGYMVTDRYADAVTLKLENGWTSAPFSNHFKTLTIVRCAGYLPTLTTGGLPSMGAPQLCPAMYPEWVSTDSVWKAATGGYYANTIYIRGGTYAFNHHLGRSLESYEQTVAPNLRKLSTLRNPAQRFLFTDTTSPTLRVVIARNEDYAGKSSEGYQPNWIHNNATNFLFGDGHVQAIGRDNLPEVTSSSGWATDYASGKEGVVPLPW